MYNGIGLETPRGTGTNGYIQRNLAHVVKQREKIDYNSEEDIKKLNAELNPNPNMELLAHERKRKVELKCLELRDLMEEQGYTDEEIEEKVNEYRTLLLKQLQRSKSPDEPDLDRQGRPMSKETHKRAELQQQKNARVRNAFGIGEDYVEGSSMEKINKKPADATEERKDWEQRFEHEKRAEKVASAAAKEMESEGKKKEKKSKEKDKEAKEKHRKRHRSPSSSSSSSSSSSDSDSSSNQSSSSSSSSQSEAEKSTKRRKNDTASPSFRDKRRITSPRRRRSKSPRRSSDATRRERKR